MATGSQKITVVRHGETEWSASGQHTGRTDLALTSDGEREAQAAGRWLADQQFDRVWTSPLQRASHTCEIAGYADTAEVYDDLMEWDYGEYEGRTRADITQDRPDWDVWTAGAPGGESVEQMQTRIDGVVQRLREAPGHTLLFAHGHLLRGLASVWVQLPVTEGRRLPLDTAAAGVLGWYHDRRALTRWNVRPG